MFNIIEIVNTEEVKDGVKNEVLGDKFIIFKESILRRFCNGIGSATGTATGGIVGYIINQAAIATGAPGALFVIVGGAMAGLLTFDISNGVCKEVLDKASVKKIVKGGEIIQYEKVSDFCAKILNTEEDKFISKMIKGVGKIVGRCGRYRVIKVDEL